MQHQPSSQVESPPNLSLSQKLRQLPQSLKILFKPLQRALPSRAKKFSKLPPRQKSRVLVQALQDATLECLREQHHLIAQDWKKRDAMLTKLAESFTDGKWCPEGLLPDDVAIVPDWMISSVVMRLSSGQPVGGFEVKIHELYEAAAANPAPVPQVSPGHRASSEIQGRRAGPRRRM